EVLPVAVEQGDPSNRLPGNVLQLDRDGPWFPAGGSQDQGLWGLQQRGNGDHTSHLEERRVPFANSVPLIVAIAEFHIPQAKIPCPRMTPNPGPREGRLLTS